MEQEMIPFAKDSNVCGFKTKQINLSYRMSSFKVRQYVGEDWAQLGFDDSTWKTSRMPMGENVFCSELQQYKNPESWSRNSNLFVRREFELSPEVFAQLQNLKVEYIVDNDIVGVYVNGKKHGNYPTRDGCHGVSRVDIITIAKSQLKVGKNIFALHVHDRGAQSFLNLKLALTVCSDNKLSLVPCTKVDAPPMCRKRCDTADYCSNSDDCSDTYVPDVAHGECLCEIREAQFCSGPYQKEDEGVCYPSPWIVGSAAVKVACPVDPVPCL
eukprot:CAMPEP_0198309244 /NCGR_PEP_ID=MMETSP1450-20131203/1681_1 /TAXON_ID=753684 ORGANISM="Madagascaria erythrocladiodes, Strain CCMP3234" /NCGR_SAMPLE_ID=MMETSP1450 /ASSEMBLY_ACC=CAM_ASM_001115 /LENGTH=269 /DNA_ID=CAMNT_0044011991 /DNA_START=107 /DNA_END=916 /DNA_ORIENTATION=+